MSIIIAILFVILLMAVSAAVFREASQDVRDVFLFFGHACCRRDACIGFRSERILKMCRSDMNVAVFASPFVGGGVRLWYCPHGHRYELRYAVQFRTPSGGVCGASALCAYDAGDGSQVVDLMLDAIDIANTPLLDRD